MRIETVRADHLLTHDGELTTYKDHLSSDCSDPRKSLLAGT